MCLTTWLAAQDFDKVVEQNRNPDIVSRRNNRRIMRGLALTKHAVHNPFTRTEHHSVPDGTETYTDSEGNTHTRTRYTTVPVQMTYTNGVMHVSAKTDKEYSRGFGANLRYTDGHGIAVAPHTGQHHTIHNRCVRCTCASGCAHILTGSWHFVSAATPWAWVSLV